MTEVSSPPEYESTNFLIDCDAISASWSWGYELHDFRPQQPHHHGLLRVEAILGLVEHDRLRPIDDLVGDFLAAMRGQAVHHERVARGALEHRLVQLKFLEVAPPLRRFLLLAHRGPGVGVNDVGIFDGFGGIVGDDAELFAPHPLDEIFLRLISRRTRDPQLEPAERRRLDPALRHIESIAEERDAQLAHSRGRSVPAS